MALDGTASVTLHLSTRRRVCVAATLQGRRQAPEHCLDAPHGTADLSHSSRKSTASPSATRRPATRTILTLLSSKNHLASSSPPKTGSRRTARASRRASTCACRSTARGGGEASRRVAPPAVHRGAEGVLQSGRQAVGHGRGDRSGAESLGDRACRAELPRRRAVPPQATAESLGLFEQRSDVVVSWPDGPPAPLAADASAKPAATTAPARSKPL